MPKVVLRLLTGEYNVLFVGIVDYFVDGDPVCHESFTVKQDAIVDPVELYSLCSETGYFVDNDHNTYRAIMGGTLAVS